MLLSFFLMALVAFYVGQNGMPPFSEDEAKNFGHAIVYGFPLAVGITVTGWLMSRRRSSN